MGLSGGSTVMTPRAAEIAGPAYAIDDETVIRVADGAVDVVSEGHWRHFTPEG